MNLKYFGKVFTSKFVGTGPSSYKKRIYRAAVSQRLRNTGIQYLLNSKLVGPRREKKNWFTSRLTVPWSLY